MNNKRLYIRTFGCQMNMRDSEFAAGILLDKGFALTDSPVKADVILFNSCSVRKHAEERTFSNIGELKDLKRKRPELVIGLIGCTAQSFQDKAFRRAPLLDFVCGPGNEADLPAIIGEVMEGRCAVVATHKVDEPRPELFPRHREGSFKTHVSIGEGCNNFCSYCIVPYVRGRERSRDPKDIVREVRDLAARGFKEITLLGQNVNSYKGAGGGGPGAGFIKLLEEVNAIDGIERIRFMTSHPKDAHIELFRAMRDLDKVCEHLHLPVQSGSDRILKLMNRGYTARKYFDLVEAYRKLVPDGAITTDMIVGFPTESAADFRKTRSLMEGIGFDGAYMFKYSPRPPARSHALKDDVLKEVKERRLAELLGLQSDVSLRRNRPLVRREVEILVDGVSNKDAAAVTGRTRTNKVATFKGTKKLVGKSVRIMVESVSPFALKGRIVPSET